MPSNPSNETLQTREYPTQTTVLTQRFLREIRSKHDVEDVTFLVDGVPWLQTALDRAGLDYRHETVGDRTAVERGYIETKRRTSSFSNTFRQADPRTAENWLVSHTTCIIRVSKNESKILRILFRAAHICTNWVLRGIPSEYLAYNIWTCPGIQTSDRCVYPGR